MRVSKRFFVKARGGLYRTNDCCRQLNKHAIFFLIMKLYHFRMVPPNRGTLAMIMTMGKKQMLARVIEI